MAKITRVELLMVDLTPKVKRVDAIQSFVSQETPIVRVTDADGVTGTGYSYTIGTGGHAGPTAVVAAIASSVVAPGTNVSNMLVSAHTPSARPSASTVAGRSPGRFASACISAAGV